MAENRNDSIRKAVGRIFLDTSLGKQKVRVPSTVGGCF